MKRWKCTQCGSGVNAPGRMRRDDVRRYCLACSKTTGRLVQRTCPVLDREREQKAARRAAKAKAFRDRRTAKVTFAGVNVPDLATMCWAKLMRLGYVKQGRRPPRVEVKRTQAGNTRGRAGVRGMSDGLPYVTFYIGPDADAASIKELVLHEMCHHIDGAWDRGDHNNHDHRFNGALCDVAHVLWGFDVVSSGEGYEPSRKLQAWLRENVR